MGAPSSSQIVNPNGYLITNQCIATPKDTHADYGEPVAPKQSVTPLGDRLLGLRKIAEARTKRIDYTRL